MIVDLTGFLDDGEITKVIQGEIDTSSIDFSAIEVKIVSPIKFDGIVYRVSDNYALDLKITYSIKTDCDRCLKSLEREVETRLFGKLVDNHDESLIDNEDFEELIYLDKKRIDLSDHIVEQVITSIPMKNLCEDDCKGLCHICGVDFNIETCQCHNNIVDPRFEKLKELFPDK